jgi:hypothetical protein
MLSSIPVRKAEILLSKGKDAGPIVSVSNLGLKTNHAEVCVCSFVIIYCLLVGVLCCLFVSFERIVQTSIHLHAKATNLPYIYTDNGNQRLGSSKD